MKNPPISSYQQNNFYSEFNEITKEINPKLIVEFGILNGYSLSVFVISRNNKCGIHAYDLFDDFPYNAADYKKTTERFAKYDNLKIEKLDFYEGFKKYDNESIDILHIDIANNGDVFEFAINNYMPKITSGGCILLEGGSKERDEVYWMNEFNKRKINPYLESIKDKFNITIIEKYPSLTIIKK